MRVLIVANTAMNGGAICVGAHDVDNGFRSLRLFPGNTTRFTRADALEIGKVYDVEYTARPGATAPHVEDVTVTHLGGIVDSIPDVAAFVAAQDTVWCDVDEIFDGTLSFTEKGGAYVESGGPLPARSTGYWRPHANLRGYDFDVGGFSYYVNDCEPLKRVKYVGIEAATQSIPAGSLVRLSLSHPITAGGATGCWMELSGWFPA